MRFRVQLNRIEATFREVGRSSESPARLECVLSAFRKHGQTVRIRVQGAALSCTLQQAVERLRRDISAEFGRPDAARGAV